MTAICRQSCIHDRVNPADFNMEFWLHVIVETRVRRAILTWARVEEFRVLFARAREQDELGVDEGHRPVVDARIISLMERATARRLWCVFLVCAPGTGVTFRRHRLWSSESK